MTGQSTPSPVVVAGTFSPEASIGNDLTYVDNGVTGTEPEVEGYYLNDHNKWGWITLYVITIVIAVLGNLLFIIGSLCTRRCRNTGHYLLLNLSLRDILLAGICIPATLDSEIIALDWNLGLEFCISFRFFYYCFLFFLPLSILFLSFHLFVENCKWNFSGDEGYVPRPWPHTIYIPLIWFFSAVFAVPTAFFSDLQSHDNDPYRNNIETRVADTQVCMHKAGSAGEFLDGSIYFYVASFILTFLLPVILLFIPWWALLVQISACCTKKLRSQEFWLSLITIFLILIFEASRAPFELYNIHYVLTKWDIGPLPIGEFIQFGESYLAVMKWAVYAPVMINPIIYLTFCPDARHGIYILFSRLCSCCTAKSGSDPEASDDEKNKMLPEAQSINQDGSQDGLQDPSNIPLQSKEEDQM
jgi:hypothetical protein